jgi:Cell wall-active antibiotics response 4TMS YvqF
MGRWSFMVGAVLIVVGVLSILGIAVHIFWPLILIAIGVWIVLGITRRPGRAGAPREQASVPLDGAREAAITVRHGAGRMTIGAGAGGDQLLSGTFGGGLDASRHTENGRLIVDARVRDRDVGHYIFGPWRHGWAGALDWDFVLNPGIPLSLRLETGASEARLSLGDLQVRELVLKTGASSTTVDLPQRAGHTRVTVESGAAAIKIRVPQGVGAFIVVRSTFAGIHVDRLRFPESAAGYRSADFDTAQNKVEIFVESAMGSVDIS